MATEIQTKFKDLIVEIDANKYFIPEFHAALADHKVTREGVAADEYTDKQLVLAAHDFWDGLPDSPTIRRPPFFQLCNIAESIFDLE